MDPVLTLTALTKVISDDLVRKVIDLTAQKRQQKAAAQALQALTKPYADLTAAAIGALDLSELADRALNEVSVLAEPSVATSPRSAETIKLLRTSVTRLITRDIEQALGAILTTAGVTRRDSIAGVSVSEMLERQASVQQELQQLLDAPEPGPGSASSGVALVRSLSDVAYSSRALAKSILTTVEQSLRAVPPQDEATP